MEVDMRGGGGDMIGFGAGWSGLGGKRNIDQILLILECVSR